MATNAETKELTDIEDLTKEVTENRFPAKLILFNDEEHDMIEVMIQICLALKCSDEKAKQIMLQAHHKGSTVAMRGTIEKVRAAAKILREIDLKVEVDEG